MGLLDDAENLAAKDPSEVQNLTQDAEKFADDKTGNKFDSQVQAGGGKLDQMIEGQDQSGQGGQGQ